MAGSRASFIPPQPQRELRELTRYRASLVGERARLVNRIQKVLEDTNIKLASVVTDITGVTARAILRAFGCVEKRKKGISGFDRHSLRQLMKLHAVKEPIWEPSIGDCPNDWGARRRLLLWPIASW